MAVTDTFCQGVQAMIEALRASITDPDDQIRILSALASYQASPLPGTSAISTAIQTVSSATAALCRRAVLTSLARACSAFQPTSSTQVRDILTAITPLFDSEVLYAADQGDMETYQSLRSLRARVVIDLETRSASLPALIDVTLNTNMPSLVIAYAMYSDTTRAAQLLTMNPSVVHPLIFSTNFEALSS